MNIVDGRMIGGPDAAALLVSGDVHTDSRVVTDGSVFFAMPGEVSDGHLFVHQAAANGAVLLIVEREVNSTVPQVVVASGRDALAALASAVVDRVRRSGRLSVLAVTGSNGKTTTKNMLHAILAGEGPTVAPPGSFNNDVGAPISMLAVDDATQHLVVEMGADALGDIRRLVGIAMPDVGIVLGVGFAHISKFGSADAIAVAKAEMVNDLPPTAVAVLNADDHRVVQMAGSTAASVSWFGLSDAADVQATDIEATADGTQFTLVTDGTGTLVRLRILGEHHVMNALAAIAACLAIGIPVERSVPRIESLERAEKWRMEVLKRADGITVINDAYNASPDSMAAALKTLAQVTRGGGRSIAILGEMAELGEFADEQHDRIGRLAVRLNVQKLIVVGHDARHIHNAAGLEGSWDGESVLVQTADEAYDLLDDQLLQGDVVLVKSSNSAGLRFLGDRIAGIVR